MATRKRTLLKVIILGDSGCVAWERESGTRKRTKRRQEKDDVGKKKRIRGERNHEGFCCEERGGEKKRWA